MKYYSRKVDNGWAIQIIEVTDENKFHAIYFEELGNGYHTGFIPNEFEEGKEVKHGFYSRFGFKRFYPSDDFLDWKFDIEDI